MVSNALNLFKLLLFTYMLAWPGHSVIAQDNAADSDSVVKVVYHADFADPRRFSAMRQAREYALQQRCRAGGTPQQSPRPAQCPQYRAGRQAGAL
jgi:hypothetical protein